MITKVRKVVKSHGGRGESKLSEGQVGASEVPFLV